MTGTDKQKQKKKGNRYLPGNTFSPKKKKNPSGAGGGAGGGGPTAEPGPSGARGDAAEPGPGGGDAAAVAADLGDWDLDTSLLLSNCPSTGPQTRSCAASGTDTNNEMRLLHLKKLEVMWNHAIKNHGLSSPDCSDMEFTTAVEVHRGLVVQQGLECKNCKYKTEVFKLYNEVDPPTKKPGPKAAAVNVALQVALMGTTMFNTKVRSLLSAMDLRVPSRHWMETTAAKVSTEQEKVAEAGMKEKLAEVTKATNKRLKIGADTIYNTSRKASSRRTGVILSTQAVTRVVEHNTNKNYVVAQVVQNQTGKNANLPRFEHLSERRA